MSFWERVRKTFLPPPAPPIDKQISAFERRKRSGLPERTGAPSQKPIILAAAQNRSSWSLVCVLAKSPHQPHHEDALNEIRNELKTRRGKTNETIEEMTALVIWAVGVINPINGRTAESGGKVHQVVGDIDDLELALELAETRDRMPPGEIEQKRNLIRQHAD